MQYSTVALLAFVAAASAQTPPGCQTSFSGTFEISPKNISSSEKRDLNIFDKRQGQACTSTPVITLQDGTLTDQKGRTGEIVSNYQFQFDNPTQTGAKFTTGFSICENGTLAVGGSAVFYSCLSGTFDNLYSESQGGQCFPVYIDTIPCVGPSGSAAPETASSTPVASSSSAVSVTPASSTPVTTSSTPVVTSAPTSSMAPLTMTMAAPFPVANSTTVATGTAVASTAPTKATTSAPATFTPGSGANMLAAGSKVFAAMVGLVAFAMF